MTVRPIFVVIAALGVTPAYADDYVNRADANGDGFVSLYELRAAFYADPAFNRRIEQMFEQYDRNGDGRISADERGPDRAAAGGTQTPGGSDSAADELAPLAIDKERRDVSRYRSSGVDPARSVAKPVATMDANSRMKSWIAEVDANNSGGASANELIASSDGQRWFSKDEFDAADKNGDKELNEAELAALVRSLERRQR